MITTPFNQFIYFSSLPSDDIHALPLFNEEDLHFLVTTASEFSIGITNKFGHILTMFGDTYEEGWQTIPFPIATYLAQGDEFRVILWDGDNFYYSNLFVYCNSEYAKAFEYKANFDTFAPYSTGSQKIVLLANRTSKNDKTEKEEYTDANGKINRPYISKREEIELEFDFVPEEVHERIMFMLSHPILYIDGVQYIQNGDYEIDWDNKITRQDIDLMKGKVKLSKQTPIIFKN